MVAAAPPGNEDDVTTDGRERGRSMGRLRGMDPTINQRRGRRRHLPAAALVGAAGALGLLGACGGDDDDAAETPTTVAAVGSDATGTTDAAIAGDGDPAEGEQQAQDYGCRA